MKILFIDNRESDPIKLLKEKINNDDIELKNLEIGDFIFQQNGTVISQDIILN